MYDEDDNKDLQLVKNVLKSNPDLPEEDFFFLNRWYEKYQIDKNPAYLDKLQALIFRLGRDKLQKMIKTSPKNKYM